MVYDPHTDAMHIKVAQGLSDAVVASTRVRRGEGLAGLAVSGRSILLIDEQTNNERIKDRMSRHELVSSLVAPLIPESTQEPLGILSLRTTNPQQRFTQEHVELLRRLLDLASASLGSLRFAFSQPSS